jgi:hypothetical protein
MRRTFLTAGLGAVLAVGVPAAAQAGPEHDAAENSQTIEVAWLMPGPFRGYATFPQTYLPGGVPACGEGAVQVDVYKYGTPEVRRLVDELLARGVLTSPADDARVSPAPRQYRFVELTPCDEIDPGIPVDPGDPLDPGDPADPDDPGDPVDPVMLPTALPARPIVAAITYAG